MAKKQPAQRARYTGAGEHYEGIPARDLTPDELAALAEWQRALVASGRLYALEDDGAGVPVTEDAPQEPAASGEMKE